MMKQNNTINFLLNGCDINFIVEAPADITLEQLLKQCDKIVPDYCACGICSLDATRYDENIKTEVQIGYNSIRKVSTDAPFTLKEENDG